MIEAVSLVFFAVFCVGVLLFFAWFLEWITGEDHGRWTTIVMVVSLVVGYCGILLTKSQ